MEPEKIVRIVRVVGCQGEATPAVLVDYVFDYGARLGDPEGFVSMVCMFKLASELSSGLSSLCLG